MLELVLGGQRSGKSRHAEALVQATQLEKHYVATAEAWDDEMETRIQKHRDARSEDWVLHECPLQLSSLIENIVSPQRVILVDCLTLWLTNQLLHSPDTVESRCDELVSTLARVSGHIVLVSNEVGQGVVPADSLSRRFVDQTGLLHQAIASHADRVWWVVAGLPQLLKGNA